MNELIRGTIAGVAATVPMTLAMELLQQGLPWYQRYALPPRRILRSAAHAAGLRDATGDSEWSPATLVAHFGYGGAVGAVYAPLSRRVPVPRAVSGPVYALGVWAGSYLGWLPAADLHEPATDEPARRNALMIAAHLVWGVAAGLMLDALESRQGAG